jgi:hypothetical protein
MASIAFRLVIALTMFGLATALMVRAHRSANARR